MEWTWPGSLERVLLSWRGYALIPSIYDGRKQYARDLDLRGLEGYSNSETTCCRRNVRIWFETIGVDECTNINEGTRGIACARDGFFSLDQDRDIAAISHLRHENGQQQAFMVHESKLNPFECCQGASTAGGMAMCLVWSLFAMLVAGAVLDAHVVRGYVSLPCAMRKLSLARRRGAKEQLMILHDK